MRIALNVLRSPLIVRALHLAHVEAILLLPRNQGIRRRFKELYREYSQVDFNHSGPYWGESGTDDDDRRSAIIAALRPILAVELMLTDGRYQTMLASYRQACLQKDEHEMRRIEQLVAEKEEEEPDRPADVPLHVGG